MTREEAAEIRCDRATLRRVLGPEHQDTLSCGGNLAT